MWPFLLNSYGLNGNDCLILGFLIMDKLKLMYEYIILKPRPKQLPWYDLVINNYHQTTINDTKESSGK